MVDDATATGIHVGGMSFTGSADTAEAPDHYGGVIGLAVYNQRKEVSCNGIIKTKGSGLVTNIGVVCTFANATSNSRVRLSEDLDVTPVSGAGVIITSSNMELTGTGFESGTIGGVYFPYLVTSSPVSLTDA